MERPGAAAPRRCIPRFAALALAALAACGSPDGSLPDARDVSGVVAELDLTPPALTNAAIATFEFHALADVAGFQCRVDADPLAACTSPHTTAALPDGEHTFAVRALGRNGIDQTAATLFTWTIDTTAPDTLLVAGPATLTTDTTFAVTLGSDEPGATFACSLDGGSAVPCDDLAALSLADGPHLLVATARDLAGNEDPTPLELGWTIDSSLPETLIVDGPSGTVGPGPRTFTFAAPALVGAVTFECAVDGAAFAACTSPLTLPAPAHGDHLVAVRAVAQAGADPTPAERAFAVDAETTVAFTATPPDPSSDALATFAFAGEADATFTCELVGVVAATPCTSPWQVAAANGSRTAIVVATDGFGNTASTSYTWTIAATAPAVTIVSGPADPTNQTDATLAYSLGGDVASVACSVDGVPLAGCATPLQLAGPFGEGAHVVEVVATASGGATASDTWTWTVDLTPPTVALDGPTLTREPAPTYTFVSSGAVATSCQVDDAPPVPCTSPFTTPPLLDGTHTVRVLAVDAAGNLASDQRTVVVDTVGPALAIVSGPSGLTADATPTFGFTADPDATLTCRVDGGAATPCTSPVTLSALADGDHTFEVQAVDPAGNPSAQSRAFTVDTTPPALAVSVDSPTADATPPVVLTIPGDALDPECRIDAGPFGPCGDPLIVAALADGSHGIDLRAHDAVGNVGAATATVVIDTTGPAVVITGGPNGVTGDPMATFTFTVDATAVDVTCAIDGGAPAPCSDSFTSAALADGPHLFEVTALDALGNGGDASRAFTVDSSAPTVTITSGPSGAVAQTAATFTFTVSEPGATVTCRFDGGAWTACASPIGYGPLDQGAHLFEVRALDGVHEASASRTFVVDTIAPVLTLGAVATPTQDTTPTVGFTLDDGSATTTCWVDGDAPAPCSSPFTSAPLSEGSHTVHVRAVDAAGNAHEVSATVVVDLTAPTVAITAGPSGVTADPTPTFAFITDDPGATLSCQVDGGAFVACASPRQLAALADGAHTFVVRATDAAGNSADDARGFTVDTTVPTVTITGGPAAGSTTDDSTPTFTFTDTFTSTRECKVDAGSYAACTSPATTAALADGVHTFTVRVTGPAGTQASASRTFTVDTSVPTVTITAGPSGFTADSTPTFTFTDTFTSTRECKVDAGAYAACTSPHTTAALADGAHTFTVRVTGPAGATATASRSFTVDTTVPTVTITAAPAEGSTTDQNNLTIAFTDTDAATRDCKLDAGAFASCTSPYITGVLADGAHTFTVRVTGPAGATATASRTFTIDTTVPTVTITGGPAAGSTTDDSTPTFTFTDTFTSTRECKVDAGAYAACTSPHTTAALTDGAHTFTVRVTGPAGAQATASRTFTIDTTVPTVTITGGPAAGSTTDDSTPTFTFTDTFTSTRECKVDAGSYAACTSPHTTAALADGAHTFTVRVTGPAGAQATASRTFTIDTTTPTVTITGGPAAGSTTDDSTPTFTFTDTFTSTRECKVDAGSYAACTSPHTTAALADGEHTFTVRVTGPAGAQATVSRTFTIDTTTPTVTITAGPSGPTSDSTPTFTFTDTFASTRECKVDAGSYAACTSPFTSVALGEGDHSVTVRVTGPAGAQASASRDFTVDTQAPTVAITGGPNGGGITGDTTPTFTFTTSGSPTTVTCDVDGGAPAACTSPHTTATLAAGNHVFTVHVADAAGNTASTSASFTVDTDAPVVTITSGPAGPTTATTATFTFTVSEAGATVTCRLGGAWTACTSPVSYPGLAEGAYLFEVRADDGVQQVTASRSFTVDTTAPTLTLGALASPTADTTPTLTFTVDDASATTTCWVDGDAPVACAAAFTSDVLTEGSHTFHVRAVDAAGNADERTRTTVVDTTAPGVSIVSGPAAGSTTSDDTPTFGFTSADPTATFTCGAQGGSFVACTSPFTFGTLADGAYVFEVRASDLAGNQSVATRAFTVDTTTPTVTITGGPAAGSTTDDSTPTFTFTDTFTSTRECKVDAGSYAACTSPHTTAALADGAHTFTVRVTGPAGAQATASRTFTIDTTTPTVTITGGPAAGSTTDDSTPTFTFTDTFTSTRECKVDAGAYAACTSPHTTAALADGAHTFTVRVTGPAGAQATASRTFTIDTTVPTVTITGGPAAGSTTDDSTPTFTFTDTFTSTRECKVDAGAYAACTSPHTTAALADGAHTFTVRVTGPAGATATASRTFTIDTTVPTVTITGGPAAGSTTDDSTPTFTFTDTFTSTRECKVDAGAYAACTSPHTTAALTDGAHTFTVRVTGPAGAQATASRTFTIDTTVPTVTITGGPAAGSTTDDSTPTFTFTDTFTSTRECKVDAGSYAACTSPHTTAALADGAHTFTVRVTGPAGAQATASRTFTIDTTTPTVTITGGPAAGSTTNDSTPTFTFTDTFTSTRECKVDAGSYAACTSPHTTAALADGEHTFTVRVTGPAGAQATASRTFTIDTTAPTVSITAGPSGPTNDNTATFSFTSPDPTATFTCGVQGGSFVACTSPYTTAALADGAYVFEVRATDPAGNLGTATRAFTVDTAPPTVTITAPTGVTNDNTPTATFTIGAGGLAAECQVDAGAWAACTSGNPLAALADGAHTLRVRTSDAAGNTAQASRSFTVDTTPPAAPIWTRTLPDVTASTINFATFGVGQSVYEATNVEECRLDDQSLGSTGAWNVCTPGTFDVSGLVYGHTYAVVVRLRDAAGNVASTQLSHVWTPTPGLVARYELEADGTDTGPNAGVVDLNLGGGGTPLAGAVGDALLLDKTMTGGTATVQAALSSPDNSYTYTLWVQRAFIDAWVGTPLWTNQDQSGCALLGDVGAVKLMCTVGGSAVGYGGGSVAGTREWVHLAVRTAGDSERGGPIDVWVDGVQTSSFANPGGLRFFADGLQALAFGDTGAPIDEGRLYNIALTPAQICDLALGTWDGSTCDTGGGGVDPTDLIFYYPVDGDGDNHSGHPVYGGDGHLTFPTSTPSYVPGHLGEALTNDGGSTVVNDYVDAFDSSATGAYGLAFWVKDAQTSSFHFAASAAQEMWLDDIGASSRLRVNGIGDAFFDIPAGWAHVALRFTAVGGLPSDVLVYVNGTLAATLANPGNKATLHGVDRSDAKINEPHDDLRIYARDLSEADICVLAGGSGCSGALAPMFQYTFEQTGANVSGHPVYGSHGELTGGPAYGSGRRGDGLEYPANGHTADLAHAFEVAETAYTVTLWGRDLDDTGAATWSHDGSGPVVRLSGTRLVVETLGEVGLTFPAGAWTNLTVRFTAPGGVPGDVLLYVSGTLVAILPNPGNLATISGQTAFELKGDRGSIDDVAMYDRDFTDAEVCELLAEGTWDGAHCRSADGPLIFYYPFNGDALNQSGHSVYGSPIGDMVGEPPPTFVTGWDADGVKVGAGIATKLEGGMSSSPTGAYTFGTWVRDALSGFDIYWTGDNGELLRINQAAVWGTGISSVNLSLPPAGWVHVALVATASPVGAPGAVEVYVNGELVGTGANPGAALTLQDMADMTLLGGGVVFDETRVYNEGFTNQQVCEELALRFWDGSACIDPP